MRSIILKNTIMFSVLSILAVPVQASCPATTPWTDPVNLSISGGVTSNIFSAASSAGFMAVWADSSNRAHYSFSADGQSWSQGLVSAAASNVASNSDVFVGANADGFVVTWIDSSNNGWSSFSADQGASWSTAIRINPNSLSLNANSDVFVNGGSEGFVAAMIGSDNNAYVSYSNGIDAWSAPAQVTTDGSVYDQNWNSKTNRGFVTVKVVGQTAMVTWWNNLFPTYSAFFETINPFSSTTPYPILSVGFFESVPSVDELNGYYMVVSRANVNDGQTYFSVATHVPSWATFAPFATNPRNPDAGPWVAANQAGFISAWVVGENQNDPGTPVWTFSANNGFDWTPVCSILAAPSSTIGGPVGLSANNHGFVATWLDSNDSNAYASFYFTPASVLPPTDVVGCKSQNIFLSQTEYANVITWSPPTSGMPPVSYKIYRDANLTNLVATIPANKPLEFVEHNVQPKVSYTYYLVSVSADDQTSAAVSVTVNHYCQKGSK